MHDPNTWKRWGLQVADRTLRSGTVWRHYKGGTYQLICVARHEDPKISEPLAIYRQSDGLDYWAQSQSNFLGEWEPGHHRFWRVR